MLHGLWPSDHSKEDHLLLPHVLNLFAGKNTPDAVLDDLCRLVSRLFLRRLGSLAPIHPALLVHLLHGSVDLLKRIQVPVSALATSLVFLDETDRQFEFDFQREGVVHDFLHWVV